VDRDGEGGVVGGVAANVVVDDSAEVVVDGDKMVEGVGGVAGEYDYPFQDMYGCRENDYHVKVDGKAACTDGVSCSVVSSMEVSYVPRILHHH
jgi:hypothetical protein